jgi:23S rRNA pseudouridine1911/1915/1917 synthase
MGSISLVVANSAGDGMRLDRYCALTDETVSRSRLKNGALSIAVNGKTVKMSRIVHEGDVISIEWEDPPSELPEAENIPLDIIYEDENVTVVNKQQGMVTHPGAGNWSGTLVHALLWHWKLAATGTNLRPGIVHRLDKDTSGVIITARNPETETWLQSQFAGRLVRKEYLAILSGVPKIRVGEIKSYIFRDPKNRKRFACSDDESKGKFAHTSYRVVSVYGSYCIVRFSLHTGRTHQLRVHSKFIGCPILGDPVYGKKDSRFPGATLMLHARMLRIALPGQTVLTEFTAPVPVRFKKVLARLKELYPGA